MAAAPYVAAALLVCVKMRHLFSAEPLQGWDTIGHLHLASVYRGLFAELRSTGYDPGWFQGQPAFVLYPPFFYFVVALLDLALGRFLPLAAAFNLSILLVVLLYCCAWLSFARLFLDDSHDPLTRGLLALAGLLLPLTYPGDGLQGAGLVGVLGGTFVSTLGLALALAAVAALERHRRAGGPASLVVYLAAAGLLLYSHYLSTIFFYALLALYLAAFRRDLRGVRMAVLALAPLALGAPIVWLYARSRPFSSATAQATYYPPLLSLMGKDFYAAWRADPSLRTLAQQLLANLKITQVLAVALFAGGVGLALRGRLRTRAARFICAASLVFLWLALDTSPALLASALPVHWYRAFDFFLALFSLMAAVTLGWIAQRLSGRMPAPALPAAFLALLAVRFVSWDPVAHEEYRDTSLARSLRFDRDAAGLAAALESLPRGSVILPEVLRSRGAHGSPHWLDHLIQSAGHRNALGLTIESSLTPLVTYTYLAQGMGQVFVWGIDPSWSQAVFAGLAAAAPERVGALPRYLAAAGVGYVITQSEAGRAYAEAMPKAFERVFAGGPLSLYRVAGALPAVTALAGRPWGLVDLAALRGARLPARRLYREFLLHANWAMLNAGVEPIINLSPTADRIAALHGGLEGLIVVNTGADPATYHSLPPQVRSGLPLILVNFVSDPSLGPGVRVLALPGRGGAGTPRGRHPEGPAAARFGFRSTAVGGSAVRAGGPLAPLGGGADAGAAAESPASASLPAPGKPAASSPPPPGMPSPSAPTSPPTPIRALEVRLSYSPQWRSGGGEQVYQTGLNHMLILQPEAGPAAGAPAARAGAAAVSVDLRLESPLARVVTLAMALLLLAGSGAAALIRLLSRSRK